MPKVINIPMNGRKKQVKGKEEKDIIIGKVGRVEINIQHFNIDNGVLMFFNEIIGFVKLVEKEEFI